MSSLEDNQNITETVKVEFEALLNSKDMTIQDLQSKLLESSKWQTAAERQESQCREENDRLNNQIQALERELKEKSCNIQDKEVLNKTLTESYNRQKEEIERLSKEHRKTTELVQKIEELENQIKQQELGHQREILEIREKHNKEINELRENYIKQIETYQEKYIELLKGQQGRQEQPPKQSKQSEQPDPKERKQQPRGRRKKETQNNPVISRK